MGQQITQFFAETHMAGVNSASSSLLTFTQQKVPIHV